MARLGPGNNERAWNDPPQMAFSPGGTTNQGTGSRLRMMNKRVPVPIGPSTTASSPCVSSQSGLPLSAPPMKSSSSIGPPPTGAVTPSAGSSDVKTACIGQEKGSLSSAEMLEAVQNVLQSSLTKYADTMQENVVNDVAKKLDLLYSMWREDKLNNEVYTRMYTLSQALKVEDFEKAWQLHRCLIVDYTSMCTQWMVAVKIIISQGRSLNCNTVTSSSLPVVDSPSR